MATTTEFDGIFAKGNIQPSEQILQNIMSFARCCQNVDAGGLKMRLFLN